MNITPNQYSKATEEVLPAQSDRGLAILKDCSISVAIPFKIAAHLIFFLLFSAAKTSAQLIPDNTLGAESSRVIPQGTRALISGGARRDTALFHSFLEFNVGSTQQVYFVNPTGIANILTRVTGSNVSNILGTLGITGNANLFLINPNGIIFGPNARLDLAGSFTATTADSLWVKGYEFSATNPSTPPLLAINITPGIQYGTNHLSREIRNEGNLEVGTGQSLTFYGGSVNNAGNLSAPGGRIQILGDRVSLLGNANIDVSSPLGGGTVLIGGDYRGRGTTPRANQTFVSAGVTIKANGTTPASNGGFVEVSGGNLQFAGTVDTSAPNGTAGTLLLDPKDILIQVGQPLSGAAVSGLLAANNVTLQADNDITVDDDITGAGANSLTLLAGRSLIIAPNRTISLNDGDFIAKINDENLVVPAQRDPGIAQFLMNPGSRILTRGGDLTVTSGTFGATSAIDTTNGILSTINIAGNSGNLTLSALGDITVGFVISGGTAGNGGNITFSALGNITTQSLINGSLTSNGGAINLSANGNITTGALTSGSLGGNGGAINLSADGNITTGALTSSSAVGDAGNVSLSANGSITTERIESLATGSGGQIVLSAVGNITAGWLGSGSTFENGGDITLTSTGGAIATTDILLSDGRLQAGNISLSAAGNLTTNGDILARSQDRGGNISFSAGGDLKTNGNFIANSLARAGNISLSAAGNLTTNGNFTANAPLQGGNISFSAAGNLTTNGNVNVQSNNQAGNISLLAAGNLATNGDINANSARQAGDISLSSTGNLTTNGNVTALSQLQAGDISLTSGGNLTANGNIFAAADSQGQGGDVFLDAAGDLSLIGSVLSFGAPAGRIQIISGGLFSARNGQIVQINRSSSDRDRIGIAIDARAIALEDFTINTSAETGGWGRDIEVNAADDIELRNGAIGTITDLGGGNAGNLTLNTRRLRIEKTPGTTFPFPVGIGSNANRGSSSNAGNAIVNASESIEIIGNRPGAFSIDPRRIIDTLRTIETGISTQALGSGNSGQLTIATGDLIVRDGAGITTFPEVGKGGDLTINARTIFLQGRGGLGTGTLGQDSGNLTVKAERVTLTDGAVISTTTGIDPTTMGEGNAGKLTLSVRELNIRNGSTMSSATASQGNGGTLAIVGAESVEVTGTSADRSFPSSIRADSFDSDSGNAGAVEIASDRVIVRDGGEVTTATVGQGEGGDIQIDARILELDSGRINASTAGSGNGGDITIRATESLDIKGSGFATLQQQIINPAFAGTLDLDNFNQGIITVSAGDGAAGTVAINAPNFTARNGALIATTALDRGQGGDIIIKASNILELDNSLLGTGTFSGAASGNIALNARRLVATGGAQALTTTFSAGQAGDLTVNVSDAIELNDPNNVGTLLASGLFASSAQTASGNGGDITINIPNGILNIRDRAAVSVSAEGAGNAGDINIDARSIFLGRGSIRAASISGEGGNINLKVADLLILRNNSQISTRAGTDASGGGNGGNINITAGFVLGIPQENSDIAANAFQGNGGNINITTNAIYGLQFRPQLTPLSDITASSQFGLNGQFVLNLLSFPAERGLNQLPAGLNDPSDRIATGCFADRGASFVVTGRGGLPQDPRQVLRGQVLVQDFRALATRESPATILEEGVDFQSPVPTSPAPIAEAQGWIVNEKGNIELVARAVSVPKETWQNRTTCDRLTSSASN